MAIAPITARWPRRCAPGAAGDGDAVRDRLDAGQAVALEREGLQDREHPDGAGDCPGRMQRLDRHADGRASRVDDRPAIIVAMIATMNPYVGSMNRAPESRRFPQVLRRQHDEPHDSDRATLWWLARGLRGRSRTRRPRPTTDRHHVVYISAASRRSGRDRTEVLLAHDVGAAPVG